MITDLRIGIFLKNMKLILAHFGKKERNILSCGSTSVNYVDISIINILLKLRIKIECLKNSWFKFASGSTVFIAFLSRSKRS